MRSNEARVHQVERISTPMLKTKNLEINKHEKITTSTQRTQAMNHERNISTLDHGSTLQQTNYKERY